ncbi:MAG: hypothetical protein ABSA76_14155 [Bacteroidales bacterium]
MTGPVSDIDREHEIKSQKRAVLLVSAFAAFLVPFLMSALNLALPTIGKELHVNAISLSWIISSSLLATAVFLLPRVLIISILLD